MTGVPLFELPGVGEFVSTLTGSGMTNHQPDPGHLPTILSDWRLWQEAQRLSERTIVERADVVRRLLEHSGAGPLTVSPTDIMRYVGRTTEISANSAATYHASIRAYCAWLVVTDQRLDNPTAKTPNPKRTAGSAHPISDADLVGLLEGVTRHRTRMMILLAVLAGLRVHEIAKFHDDDLDRTNGTLTVTGKGGGTEMVPAHQQLLDEAESMPRGEFWFPSYEAQTTRRAHVTRAAVYSAIKGAMVRAGVPGSPHYLRHWFASALLDAGVDTRITQEMLRHKNIGTTMLYTRVPWRLMIAASRQLALPQAA